ncbi:vasorin-like [Synchiropus splendidus]|uniref:vasorin-like n=1 Tax=Synchiropus splendidus TaxID=270530 RepID=UPI00237E89A8|nr:vasorin-like [Synchiropus splendidus]
MLVYLLLVFLLSGLVLSSQCPDDCTCMDSMSIFCINRRDSAVPAVPASTQELYVFNNGIRTLTPSDFRHLKDLQMLDMSQNELGEVPDGVFEMLSSLKNLDLSTNHITHISKDSFSGLVQLERLYLSSNRIHSIHVDAFNGLEQLLELKLEKNQLTSLPSLRLPSLLLLDLSHNNIPLIGPSDLQTPHLESLKLASLALSFLDEELIASLGNLHELDISMNQLSEVPQALKQDSLKGLIKLNVKGNPFGEFRKEDFQKLTGLQHLDIRGIHLQEFPQNFFEAFPKLATLTAAENPFNCMCPLAWFPAWLKESGVDLLRPEETRCHFPLVNAGKKLFELEYEDFGCPRSTTMVIDSPNRSTPHSGVPTPPPEATHTNAIPPPPPATEGTILSETDSYLPHADNPVVPSSTSGENEQHICPPNICLNGGTCHFDLLGELSCVCPTGTSGTYCENIEEVPELLAPSVTDGEMVNSVVPALLDSISSRQVTSTSILLDLHRFIEARPNIRGIRLTYRNLSGPDRRPNILNVPASYPEYTLRGLKPNCTYSVCASPLGERTNSRTNSSLEAGSCTEARTSAAPHTSAEKTVETKSQLLYTLIPIVAGLTMVLGLSLVVGVVVCLRRKKQRGVDMEVELGSADQEPVELDGIKVSLENSGNGSLQQKHPEIDSSQNLKQSPSVQQNGGTLDYEVPLMQGHSSSNNNIASIKPSYF